MHDRVDMLQPTWVASGEPDKCGTLMRDFVDFSAIALHSPGQNIFWSVYCKAYHLRGPPFRQAWTSGKSGVGSFMPDADPVGSFMPDADPVANQRIFATTTMCQELASTLPKSGGPVSEHLDAYPRIVPAKCAVSARSRTVPACSIRT